MTSIWMRGTAAAMALGWAMLAGSAQATVITYNFSAPASSYYDSNGNSSPTGLFAGSFSVDTAKLAQVQRNSYNDPTYGYSYSYSNDPAVALVAALGAVSGTPNDGLANSTLAQPATSYGAQLFEGTGSYYRSQYGGSFFQLYLYENFNQTMFNADTTISNSYDERQFYLEFYGAASTVVDGYVLPTPGTGTVNAYLNRNLGSNNYSANYQQYLGGSSTYLNLQATGAQTTAGEGPADVPEPGALGLLGLGLFGIAMRLRKRPA